MNNHLFIIIITLEGTIEIIKFDIDINNVKVDQVFELGPKERFLNFEKKCQKLNFEFRNGKNWANHMGCNWVTLSTISVKKKKKSAL